MPNLIDRNKLLEELHKKFHYYLMDDAEGGFSVDPYKLLNAVIGVIDSQPKVGDWISVSERLPEEDGHYLVTTKFLNFVNSNVSNFYDGKWYLSEFYLVDVIAWMPLPPAYQEQTQKQEFEKATKEIVVDIVMNVPNEVTVDEVWEKLINFSESNGWYFGGVIEEYKEGEVDE